MGNVTVILVCCSFSCKVKNFQETGVAFLTSMRVLFCFYEGYQNKDLWISSPVLLSSSTFIWPFILCPMVSIQFILGSISCSYLLRVVLWPRKIIEPVSFENSYDSSDPFGIYCILQGTKKVFFGFCCYSQNCIPHFPVNHYWLSWGCPILRFMKNPAASSWTYA